MAECEWLALVTFAKIENWQDGQGGLARVATLGIRAGFQVLSSHFEGNMGIKNAGYDGEPGVSKRL